MKHYRSEQAKPRVTETTNEKRPGPTPGKCDTWAGPAIFPEWEVSQTASASHTERSDRRHDGGEFT